MSRKTRYVIAIVGTIACCVVLALTPLSQTMIAGLGGVIGFAATTWAKN